MDYDAMLERAHKAIPKKNLGRERFEIPVMESFIQGNKTIIRNFEKTVKSLNRDPKHAFKFFVGEVATSSSMDADNLVLNGKFSGEEVQKIFREYVDRFVLCKECKKPDTKIMEQQGVKMLKCEACGALSAIKE